MSAHPARGKAILVRFHAPTTAFPGGRWSASTDAGRLYVKRSLVDIDDTGDPSLESQRVAQMYLNRHGWPGDWYGAQLQNGDWVYVCKPN